MAYAATIGRMSVWNTLAALAASVVASAVLRPRAASFWKIMRAHSTLYSSVVLVRSIMRAVTSSERVRVAVSASAATLAYSRLNDFAEFRVASA